VAVDASHLYWASSTGFSRGNGAIWRANLDGGNPQAIVTGQDNPAGVALDAAHLYWANTGDNDNSNGTINAVGPGADCL
jgi:hypothetical protein